MAVVYWVFFVAAVSVTQANTGGQYEWYDANQGSSGPVGSATGGDGLNGASQTLSRAPVYSPAATSTKGGDVGSLVSQLLAQGSSDDGLTLDLFQNLAQFADTGSGAPSGAPTSSDGGSLSQLLAEAAKNGPRYGDLFSATSPGTSSNTDSAFNQLQAAANIFTVAQGHANEADFALKKAQSDITTQGTGAIAEAASSAKAVALATIASAKAEARSSLIQSRNEYVSALQKLKEKITAMKYIERKFRELAVAFSKVRDYAGQALLSLKTMTSKKGAHPSNTYPQAPSKKEIVTTIASAKARIAKMKVVEKRFLALAQALAKVRAQAYADVRTVRKNAIFLAKTTTSAQAQVDAAVESAASIVSQAVATARATAFAKAEATADAAMAAKSKAETIVNAAAAVIEGARAQVEEAAKTSSAASVPTGTNYGSSLNNNQQGTDYSGAQTQSP